MAVLEALLAIIGFVLLLLLAMGALSERMPAVPPPDDPAAPYRAGLHAAIRMQRVAQDLEQQIYAEAAGHLEGEAEESTASARGKQQP